MRRYLVYLGWTLAIVVLLLAVSHAISPPVNPRQEVPEVHFKGPCWLCHFVSDSAKPIEVEKTAE